MKKEKFCFIDIETASPVDIKNGTENYFAHPAAHILVICFKFSDSAKIHTVTNFDRKDKIKLPPELLKFKGTFVAHNWSFEFAAFKKSAPGTRLADPANWLCTMALAHRFNLPATLETCADALKLPHRKNPDGRRLIATYSIPDKKTGMFRPIPPADQKAWVTYCKDDIKPTEEIFNKLFPLWTKEERAVFDLDRQINAYGIPIDVDGARRIEKAYARLMERTEADAEKLAGRTAGGALAISSPDGFKAFCKARGIDLPNAQAATVFELASTYAAKGRLSKSEREILDACELRDILAARAIGKTDALLKGTSADGRYRFGQIYHVAHTGRWQSWGANFYNFPRECVDADEWEKTIKQMEKAPTLAGLVSLQRGLIKAPKGKTFIVSDFAGIENRILLWLAGDTAQLARIAKGESPYLIFAEKLYPEKKVTKADTALYTKAKAAVLGLGYHQGAKKFAEMNGYDLAEAQHIVDVWRGNHPGVVKLWKDFDRAFRIAIDGDSVTVAGITFGKRKATVTVTLPDGHTLYYRGAHVRPSTKAGFEGSSEICAFFGKSEIPIAIHGGVLTENIVQAIAARLLRNGLLNAHLAGYQTVLHVYDEIVCEIIKTTKGSAKAFAVEIAKCMTFAPAWAKGLPLAVEQKITERWVK